MEIFNRPHSIAEDTLHFTIYPSPTLSDKPAVTSLAACITDYVDSLLPDFIWHRDKFEVKLFLNQDENVWALESRMRVGDCVDDEWLTVWLLKQITSKWDVVISIYDSDGEFLLIEAADVLPSWVKPTNSENRVWIYNSRLHLIPISHISPPSRKRHRRKLPGAADSDNEDAEYDNEDEYIAVEDAIKIVRDPFHDTLAPAEVEKIVWERISSYPDAAKVHLHITKAYLPVDISRALIANPPLVQRAVETFYTRDAIQLRTAHRMARFPPHSSVLSSVKMTRTAYAQLVGQKFFPPKIFGQFKEREGTNEWRWREVGMKLAVGFEMLYQESKGRANANISVEAASETRKEALRRDPEYQKYIHSLTSVGYFRGQIHGSDIWNSLENKAAAIFMEIRRADESTRQSFALQVETALTNKMSPDYSADKEDSDAWLNVDAQEFEEMLETTHAKTKATQKNDPNAMNLDSSNEFESAEDRFASEQAKQLKDLASKVEDFIEGEGDLEGALFEDEESSDSLLSDDPESSGSDSDSEIKINTAERQAAMDKLVPALEASDYGKMPPSFHSNSQRVAPVNDQTDAMEESTEEKLAPENNSEPQAKQKPIRPPIIPRDKYDGVDSDDETDEEMADESDEDHPQVVGEIEIDMEQEEEEFLEFSRQALGISEAQWSEIVMDRKDRGAFLPSSALKTPAPSLKPPEKMESIKKEKHTPRIIPEPGPRPNVNPELDSFEAVMKALDEALSQSKKSTQKSQKPQPADNGKGKAGTASENCLSAMDIDRDEDFDIDAAMEAELKEALEFDQDSDAEQPMDYNLIKNLLESFKSQEGLAGPFSNLAGRLKPDFKLPRDES